MALSKDVANNILTLVLLGKIEGALNPIFKEVSELTKGYSEPTGLETRRELLEMVQEAVTLCIGKQRERLHGALVKANLEAQKRAAQEANVPE
jgi:hypothetical protein